MQGRAQVEAAIAELVAEGAPFAVLVLRTQRMHEVALSLGYAVAEAAADALVDVVRAALRPVDQLFRIGAYDVLVLLPRVRGRAHAELAAAKLVRALDAPLVVDDWNVLPVVAIGGATSPADGTDADLLCRTADRATGIALAAGERFAFGDADADAGFPLASLRAAIADNALVLHLQEIRSLSGAGPRRYEALARWTHPELGPVSPQRFVEAAERTGLIAELTRWSLNASLRHIAAMRVADPGAQVSVNLSVDALQWPGFVQQVIDLLAFWGVPADALLLEVTEGALMRDVSRCIQLLQALRGAGIRIAIDDFGTGYASMAYLRRLPVDELKIDRSFVMDMVTDPRALRLVESMIQLSHHLGLETVAEGVEDAETMALLRGVGCDFVQGYHIGRPAPADTLLPGPPAH